MPSTIKFFVEDIVFKLSNQRKIASWLRSVALKYGANIIEINYILVSDAYLVKLNQTHLQHDTLTDIITFPNNDSRTELSGDIYISIERVKENAETFGVSFEQELFRVMVHGLLHLVGFKDKSAKDKKAMRIEEDSALQGKPN